MRLLNVLVLYVLHCTLHRALFLELNCLPDENRVHRWVFAGPKHGMNLAGGVSVLFQITDRPA